MVSFDPLKLLTLDLAAVRLPFTLRYWLLSLLYWTILLRFFIAFFCSSFRLNELKFWGFNFSCMLFPLIEATWLLSVLCFKLMKLFIWAFCLRDKFAARFWLIRAVWSLWWCFYCFWKSEGVLFWMLCLLLKLPPNLLTDEFSIVLFFGALLGFIIIFGAAIWLVWV